jgi:hypothetical protein
MMQSQPTPVQQNVDPLPVNYISDPADYASLSVEESTIAGTITPTSIVYYLIHDRQFNCLEIDAQYAQSLRGWCIPDLWAAVFVIPATLPTLAIFALFGKPALVAVTDTIDIINNAPLIYMPVKQFLSPAIGDDTTSENLESTRVFRAYGLTPFYNCTIAFYMVWAGPASIPNTGPIAVASIPRIQLRAWYDPSITQLRTGDVGSPPNRLSPMNPPWLLPSPRSPGFGR